MRELMFRQIAKKTEEIREHRDLFRGVSSWVRYIREGLGMTLKQLSGRTGLSTSTLNQLEKNEALDKVTFASLKKAAQAMNCELVYALVPLESLDKIREDQALKKAKALLGESNLQMEYEDQAVSKEQLISQLQDLKSQLKSSKRLWDEE